MNKYKCKILVLFLAIWLHFLPDSYSADDSLGPYYTGPIIDSHFHMPPPIDAAPPSPQLERDITLNEIVSTLDAEGTSKVFAFFPVYESFPHKIFTDVARKVKEEYPDRFISFIMPPTRDDNPPTVGARSLKKMLKGNLSVFQGFGEIGLYDIKGRKAEEFPPDAPIFQRIYKHVIQKHNLLVYIHPGDGHKDALDRVLEQYPDITFIVHGDQIQNDIGELMEKHSNVYFTINDLYGDQYLLNNRETKESFLAALEDYEPLLEKDVVMYKELIEAHPNQFMWGTDRGDATWTFDKEVGQKLVDYGRYFIGRLDPAVQEKFAYKNAERLINR